MTERLPPGDDTKGAPRAPPKSLVDKLYDDAEALDGIKGMERIARHLRAAAYALILKDMPLT